MDLSFTIRRVSVDFEWDLGRVWEGYINPWPGPKTCGPCRGSGYNEKTLALRTTFKTWSRKLTKHETEEFLVTHSPEELDLILSGNLSDSYPQYYTIRSELVSLRANRKGFFGLCETCEGYGEISNDNPAVISLYTGVNLYEEWQPSEPPLGSAWQLWDNVELAPISPVFETSEGLAGWCQPNVSLISGEPTTTEWLSWILKEDKEVEAERIPPQVKEFSLPSESLRIFVKPSKSIH